ncbi:MAG: hypothetical protein JWP68_603 [Modestobacter sp.]|nr:hypothetical protein [Modestobacter sp.]
MRAPTRSAAPRGPVLRRRGLTRGSLVGVGLLALTTSGMPAALAVEGADGPVVPENGQDDVTTPQGEVLDSSLAAGSEATAPVAGYFGKGKRVDFSVAYDDATVPDDFAADLSGVTFTLTDQAGVERGHCTTDVSGDCGIGTDDSVYEEEDDENLDDADVRPGTYTVTETGLPSWLAATASTANQVQLCDDVWYMDFPWFLSSSPADVAAGATEPPCSITAGIRAPHDSLFSSPLHGTVVDAVTGAPIGGAAYALTGPAELMYPLPDDSADISDEVTSESEKSDTSGDASEAAAEVPPVVRQEADAAVAVPRTETVTQTSTSAGQLVFPGWFLPGDYVLSPVGVVAGHDSDEPTIAVKLGAPSTDHGGVLAPRRLTPVSTVVTTPADPTTPSTEPTTPSADPTTPSADPTTPSTGTVLPPVTPTTAAPEPAASSAEGSTSRGTTVRTGAAGAGAPAAAGTVSPAPALPSRLPTAATTSATGSAVAPLAAAPELETVASSLPDMRVIGFGFAFLMLVIAGFGYLVRRRARARG